MRIWIGICFLLLVLPAVVYDNRLDAQLLRKDPDLIPAESHLMGYGLRSGAVEFAAHCAACHGSGGAGNAARGVPNLTDDDWLYGGGAVSEIERIVTYGIRSQNSKAWNLARMPAFGTAHPSSTNSAIVPLEPGQIRDVVEYLYTLQGRAANKDAAVRGTAVYLNSGGCYDCHSVDGRGDPAIGAPNLIDNINLYGDGSREQLFASIATGRQGVCPAWVNRLSPTEVREVALYVYSLSHLRST